MGLLNPIHDYEGFDNLPDSPYSVVLWGGILLLVGLVVLITIYGILDGCFG